MIIQPGLRNRGLLPQTEHRRPSSLFGLNAATARQAQITTIRQHDEGDTDAAENSQPRHSCCSGPWAAAEKVYTDRSAPGPTEMRSGPTAPVVPEPHGPPLDSIYPTGIHCLLRGLKGQMAPLLLYRRLYRERPLALQTQLSPPKSYALAPSTIVMLNISGRGLNSDLRRDDRCRKSRRCRRTGRIPSPATLSSPVTDIAA